MATRKHGWAYFRECAILFVVGTAFTFLLGLLILHVHPAMHG